ncbi:hypothetical protein EVAR_90663_1 [Eumeta japonica]|uniref:Uncharacterized protein n=1 Tax=Eumeta variegata TaxID=151549 RepID=A0A4C1ZCA8_EUMVA|nr:hypothetical protein EVAR_90663_1 [Eumeta japonica]
MKKTADLFNLPVSISRCRTASRFGDTLRTLAEFSFCESGPFAQFTAWGPLIAVRILAVNYYKRIYSFLKPNSALVTPLELRVCMGGVDHPLRPLSGPRHNAMRGWLAPEGGYEIQGRAACAPWVALLKHRIRDVLETLIVS